MIEKSKTERVLSNVALAKAGVQRFASQLRGSACPLWHADIVAVAQRDMSANVIRAFRCETKTKQKFRERSVFASFAKGQALEIFVPRNRLISQDSMFSSACGENRFANFFSDPVLRWVDVGTGGVGGEALQLPP